MARAVCSKNFDTFCKLGNTNVNTWVRYGHHLRGKPPGIAKSLEQRLAEENKVDEMLTHRVDIGFPPHQMPKSQLQTRIEVLKENRKKFDKSKKSIIPMDLNKAKREWLKTNGPEHIKQIADHYGVFNSLFDRAFFLPMVPVNVRFTSGELSHPVCFGNVIKPNDAKETPAVSYESEDDSFWTLTLTNLDGHLTENDKEYVHWMVANIPGNNVTKGETVFNYLQPFPPKGTGYHRYVFILYKQNKKLDFSALKGDRSNVDLLKRTFSTHEFYRDRQDDLTPGGLVFFQSDWDSSLHDFYHEVLNMKEPVFEYSFDPPYIKKEKWFPLREPFNLYMDKYRDPKQINKEFLVRKLKNVHPFKPDPPPLPYPNAQPFEGHVPTWLKLEIRKSRLRWGRINDIE